MTRNTLGVQNSQESEDPLTDPDDVIEEKNYPNSYRFFQSRNEPEMKPIKIVSSSNQDKLTRR